MVQYSVGTRRINRIVFVVVVVIVGALTLQTRGGQGEEPRDEAYKERALKTPWGDKNVIRTRKLESSKDAINNDDGSCPDFQLVDVHCCENACGEFIKGCSSQCYMTTESCLCLEESCLPDGAKPNYDCCDSLCNLPCNQKYGDVCGVMLTEFEDEVRCTCRANGTARSDFSNASRTSIQKSFWIAFVTSFGHLLFAT